MRLGLSARAWPRSPALCPTLARGPHRQASTHFVGSTRSTTTSSPPPLSSSSSSMLLSRETLRSDEAFGALQNVHIKAFPVRAAIDIGTGGVISLSIARVDAARAAITKLMYTTQLPLYLEAASPIPPPGGSVLSPRAFTLSERTLMDIRNKMRVLTGAMRRDAYEGLSERAAVISHPLCLADNAEQLAEELTREFKVNVRVLGKTFHVAWPGVQLLEDDGYESSPRDSRSHAASLRKDGPSQGGAADGAAGEHESLHHHQQQQQQDAQEPLSVAEKMQQAKGKRGRKGSLKRLLQARETREHASDTTDSSSALPRPSSSSSPCSAEAQLQQLAFLAHAAGAQCVAPQRLLVIVEDPQKGLRIVGADTSAEEDVRDLLMAPDGQQLVQPDEQQRLLELAGLTTPQSSPSSPSTHADDDDGRGKANSSGGCGGDDSARTRQHTRLGLRFPHSQGSASPFPVIPHPAARDGTRGGGGTRLLEHRIPVDAAEAHRRCIIDIQRRPVDSYGLHSSSPNPLLKEEWVSLRNLLVDVTEPTLPAWVRRKAALGGVIAGTSFNGGVLNLAARVAQRAPISLEHVEVNAQYHFCGLTDVLLSATFPNPLLVLPSAALAASLMRALHTPRISYLPELSTATALLVQPSLWSHSKSSSLRRTLHGEAFYRDVKQRTFARPHRKENPTAAPDADWVRHGTWNDLSMESSLRGT